MIEEKPKYINMNIVKTIEIISKSDDKYLCRFHFTDRTSESAWLSMEKFLKITNL